MKEHRCQQAPRLTVRWPLGLDLLVGAFSADREGRLLDFFVSLIEENGINFDQIIFGSRAFGTVDPRNIEAILSTQFRGKIALDANVWKLFFLPCATLSESIRISSIFHLAVV